MCRGLLRLDWKNTEKHMNYDLTQGNIMKNLLKFSFPIMVGNILQQLYNVVDTLIVGRYLGKNALAAVGSSYTLSGFCDVDYLRTLHGQQCLFFYAVWQTRSETTRTGNLYGIFDDRNGHFSIKHFCLYRNLWDSCLSSCARGSHSIYEGVFVVDFCRDCGNFFCITLRRILCVLLATHLYHYVS